MRAVSEERKILEEIRIALNLERRMTRSKTSKITEHNGDCVHYHVKVRKDGAWIRIDADIIMRNVVLCDNLSDHKVRIHNVEEVDKSLIKKIVSYILETME